MKEVVLRLDIHDEKSKKKAMETVSSLKGVDSLSVDMKEKKLTVIGDVDPVAVVNKLRKPWCRLHILRKLGCLDTWHTEIIKIGEPQKKKDEPKKDEGKKNEEKKKEPNEQIAELVKAYKAYNPYMTQVYHVQSAQENPNACVIS